MSHRALKQAALEAALLLTVVVVSAQTVSSLPATLPTQRPTSLRAVASSLVATATATPPFSIEPEMLNTILGLPTALTETIKANTYTHTEIVAAQHSSKVPFEPMATAIDEAWCISVYPEVQITLYVQRYVAPKGAIFVKPGDYVPGEQHIGMIDHFLALRRKQTWELYHPEVYSWSALGCA